MRDSSKNQNRKEVTNKGGHSHAPLPSNRVTVYHRLTQHVIGGDSIPGVYPRNVFSAKLRKNEKIRRD